MFISSDSAIKPSKCLPATVALCQMSTCMASAWGFGFSVSCLRSTDGSVCSSIDGISKVLIKPPTSISIKKRTRRRFMSQVWVSVFVPILPVMASQVDLPFLGYVSSEFPRAKKNRCAYRVESFDERVVILWGCCRGEKKTIAPLFTSSESISD